MATKQQQPVSTFDVPGYERLASVLEAAYDQASRGKGEARHANNRAFHEQPILTGIKTFGIGGALFQAYKKAEECQRMEKQAAINELLGAIVYLSAAVIMLEDQDS